MSQKMFSISIAFYLGPEQLVEAEPEAEARIDKAIFGGTFKRNNTVQSIRCMTMMNMML